MLPTDLLSQSTADNNTDELESDFDFEFDFDQRPRPIWESEWCVSMDGFYETRAHVFQVEVKYQAGLTVSYMGGDSNPTIGDEDYATFEEASNAAIEMHSRWHLRDGENCDLSESAVYSKRFKL